MKTKRTFLYNKVGAIEDIIKNYTEVTMTVTDLAKKWGTTPRSIQRLLKDFGYVRTIAEANKVTAVLKNYDNLRKPEHLKAKRLFISVKRRYEMIKAHPFCTTCGNTAKECPLNIDHIDDNATNNNDSNLQVLCMMCNQGKKIYKPYSAKDF